LVENVAQNMRLLILPQLLTHSKIVQIDTLFESSLFVNSSAIGSYLNTMKKNNHFLQKSLSRILRVLAKHHFLKWLPFLLLQLS
jgi:hypothetical protein